MGEHGAERSKRNRLMKKSHDRHRSSVCDPGSNKTLLTIGQDFFSIEEYILSQYNASLHRNSAKSLHSFHPAASMVYTDIQSLRGVDEPADYGSGIEYAKGLANAFPNSGIQIGLWLNGTTGCRDIVDSNILDDNIRRLYASIASWRLPRVFLRLGYEFDNPYFGYSEDPSYYRKAFRIMVKACEKQLGYKECHSTISFCWHSWAAPRWVTSLDDFYPGDDVVDWVGISIFQQLYPWATAAAADDNNGTGNDFAGGSMSYVKEVLDHARRHDKPVMIAESTPFGGMFWNGRNFGKKDNATSPRPPSVLSNKTMILGEVVPDNENIWSLWFAPVLELIEAYDIRMWSYINCDWDSQPMWHNIGFGDTRLSSSPTIVMKLWWEKVLHNPRFVVAPLECGKETRTTDDSTIRLSSLSLRSSMALVPPTTTLSGWSLYHDKMVLVMTMVLLNMAFLLRHYNQRQNRAPSGRVNRVPREDAIEVPVRGLHEQSSRYGSITRT